MSDPAPAPNTPRLLIASPQAMTALSMSRRRLSELTTVGAIPSHKVGRSRRYCLRELAAWVAAGCPIEPGAAARVREGMSR